MELLFDALTDGILDTAKMVPFLFIAFLILEAVEHYSEKHRDGLMKKIGGAGPFIGGLLGCFPQCGFSVAAANLYSGGVITLGTMIAVFLATSDEAVLLLLGNPGQGGTVLKLILCKAVIGVILGYVYLRTRDLRYSIGIHMIINFMGGVAAPWLSAKVQTLDPDLLGNMQNLNFMLRVYGSELQKALAWVGAFGLYLLVYLGFAIAGLVLLVQNWHRALFLPAAEELPREGRGKTVYGNVGMILFLAATAVMTVITLL